MSAIDDVKPADAAPRTWVDRLPAAVRPYLRLARADRPIGVWLLLWPCWWSILLATTETPFGLAWSLYVLWLFVLFAVGAAVMRGAGCTYNDIVDRDIDAKVARTAGRPIPSGQVSVAMAVVFLVVQLAVGLGVLLQLNWFSVALGALSLVPIAIYPFMKRVTDWPQAFLGLTFNWGALLGWTAVTGGLGLAPMLLFAGCVFWTLGYDTIYAHQDKEDDLLIGVKSTALKFGANSRGWIGGFFAAAILLLAAAAAVAGAGLASYLGIMAAAVQALRQVTAFDMDDSASCLALFRSNRTFGLLIAAGFLADTII
jgi:4-hydroxybenzoate polyprenyltransferase